MMSHSSANANFLLTQGEKVLESPEGLAEACASLLSPVHHLNLLLESDLSFHRQVLTKIANRIGEELPDEFDKKETFRRFYESALRHLQASDRLILFETDEVSTGVEIGLEKAVEMVYRDLSELDNQIFTPDEHHTMDVNQAINEVDCQLITRYPAEDVRKRLGRLGQSCPDLKLFLKGANLTVKGRVFEGISVDLRLRGVLPTQRRKANVALTD